MRKIGLLSIVIALFVALLSRHDHAGAVQTVFETWDNVKSDYPASTVTSSEDPTGMTAGGIVWTRHNLSSYGPLFKASTDSLTWEATDMTSGPTSCFFVGSPPGPPGLPYQCINDRLIATTQICVFCHTPHHSRTDTAPLWNKGNVAIYTAYGTTLAGTATAVSGSSLACLSCHDGITTFDSIINRPGSGSNTDGTPDAGVKWEFSMWEEFLPTFPPQGSFDHFRTDNCGACHSQEESNRLNIGLGPGFAIDYGGLPTPQSGTADLSNDHPIGVTYTQGIASLRPVTTTLASIEMYNIKSLVAGEAATIGRGDDYWSVFGYINATATIQDLLRGSDTVECASCHDPHFKNQTNNDPSVINSYYKPLAAWVGTQANITGPYDDRIDGLFLRRVGGNSNSGVCRTCHNK